MSQASKAGKSLSGDPSLEDLSAAMIRVDQAGEFGARQIYKGQLAVLAGTDSEAAIREMAEQEDAHLAVFDRLIAERRVRPTALTPIWRAAGFALGAGTALLGARAAMACTVAVEEVIDEHYRQQSERLGARDVELKTVIDYFRADEIRHRDMALEHGAAQTPGYRTLKGAIKAGTRLAIRLSTRI